MKSIFGKSRRALFSLPLFVAAAAAAAGLLLASCAAGFKLDGESLISFAETVEAPAAGGLRLNLSRDRESVFGSWEDVSLSRYGLVEGAAKADGSLSLRFYGVITAAPVGALKGAYAGGESRIEGKLVFGDEAARPVTLASRKAVTDRLSLAALRSTTREGLPSSESEATRFIYEGFEPSAPPALRDFYRRTFQGGKTLKAIMALERDEFLDDHKVMAAELKKQMGETAVHPWYYEGRQILTYRGGGLLVMALRRGIFTGSGEIGQTLRHAVIDEVGQRVLGPGDFLAEGWEGKLPAILAAGAREELGLASSASLVGEGFVADEPQPSADFFIYSKGIGFHYAPGKLAPKESGELFLIVPFGRLQGLLRPEAMSRFGLAAGGATQ